MSVPGLTRTWADGRADGHDDDIASLVKWWWLASSLAAPWGVSLVWSHLSAHLRRRLSFSLQRSLGRALICRDPSVFDPLALMPAFPSPVVCLYLLFPFIV